MRQNRSIPSATVIPVLIYPDVREAVAWLSAAFGFVERLQIGESHRSQLSFGDGAVIVGDVRHDRSPPRAGEVTHSVLVRVEDANAHCARARDYGAHILMEPTDFEYGERQYTAEDLAGHQCGRSRRRAFADVAPETWGGTPRSKGLKADLLRQQFVSSAFARRSAPTTWIYRTGRSIPVAFVVRFEHGPVAFAFPISQLHEV